MKIERKGGVTFFLLILTIGLGVASRYFSNFLPSILHKNAGDILWATALYFLLVLISRKSFPGRVFLLTSVLGVAVECLKLYHSPWLEQFRQSTAGGLILGHAFQWTNMVCYVLGALLGMILDAMAIGVANASSRAKR